MASAITRHVGVVGDDSLDGTVGVDMADARSRLGNPWQKRRGHSDSTTIEA